MATSHSGSGHFDSDTRDRIDRFAGVDDEDVRRLAIRRLRRKRSFRGHLVVYLTATAAFWTVWIVGGLVDQWIFPWPVIPTLLWGLFVLGQARDVYGGRRFSEEELEREMTRLRNGGAIARHDFDDLDEDWWWWPPPPMRGFGPRSSDDRFDR